MTPENCENLIIAEIEALGLPSKAYPDNPDKYYPNADPGEVLVRYEGRKPAQKDISAMLSEITWFFEIVVVTRVVRGEHGAYDWLQKVHNSLQGFTLEGAASPLMMQVESFMNEDSGLWQFGQKWTMTTLEEQLYTDQYDSHLGD